MFLNKSSATLWRTCFSFLGFTTLLLPTSSATLANELSNNADYIHTRTLAASCAACHGTNGNSLSITPVLAGLDAHYFSTQMLAFKQKGRASTVMHHHASGLTEKEINQLANYFSQQERISRPLLSSETLREKP